MLFEDNPSKVGIEELLGTNVSKPKLKEWMLSVDDLGQVKANWKQLPKEEFFVYKVLGEYTR